MSEVYEQCGDRELFIDDFLTESRENLEFQLHRPTELPADPGKPNGHYLTLLKHPGGYRMYYRGLSPAYTGPIKNGNPGEFTILQLAELVIELTNSQSRIVRRELPADDPKQRRPDITLAEKLLDWRPTTPLREGLTRTIAYFDELLKTDPEFCRGQ